MTLAVVRQVVGCPPNQCRQLMLAVIHCFYWMLPRVTPLHFAMYTALKIGHFLLRVAFLLFHLSRLIAYSDRVCPMDEMKHLRHFSIIAKL